MLENMMEAFIQSAAVNGVHQKSGSMKAPLAKTPVAPLQRSSVHACFLKVNKLKIRSELEKETPASKI